RKTDVYEGRLPLYTEYEGRKAARLRSEELSGMAERMQQFLDLYPSGLSEETEEKRNINKLRILEYFGADETDWEDWNWHLRHVVRKAKILDKLIKLTDEEYQAVELANEHEIPFGITPYYLSLIDFESHREKDYALRAQVIPTLHYVNKIKDFGIDANTSMDFMLERDTSPIEGITRRYPKIVIIKPILTCPQICVYCQRNWQIKDVYSADAAISADKLEQAVQWIKKTPEINEVLITGGDPLLLSDEKIEKLLERLSAIDHVVRIRIGTRMLVTLPQRITDSLLRIISRFNVPGKREVIIMTHFEHSYEISSQTLNAVQKFRQNGMEIYNQLVYTFYNSKRFEAVALRLALRSIGVTPYYTFNTKGKDETYEYRVPIPRLLQEQQEEARLLPGTVRTDEIVFNVPKLGKNYLRAGQHHDVISILPDGRRVYEFHPWEKKISQADTYIYTDVSIYDYLERLQKSGEKISDYKTIWYYY
ncbi:MAG TPA: KamA family radical SAM protein, partial [Desulfobacteraceae bacterium]|nr:KamA family radical SAM protein [Desulfobacteraceae bacterium]